LQSNQNPPGECLAGFFWKNLPRTIRTEDQEFTTNLTNEDEPNEKEKNKFLPKTSKTEEE